MTLASTVFKQEGQVALNSSPELYLLRVDHVPGDTWGRATFWPKGNNLYKLGRGQFGDSIHTNHQDSRPNGFRQEDFFMFSLCKPMYSMCPLGRKHFWPKGHDLNKLGRGQPGNATYHILRL